MPETGRPVPGGLDLPDRDLAALIAVGWATKPGQERVLAIAITRDGFEWALAHACLSHHQPGTYASRAARAEQQRACPVRVQ